MSWAFYMTVDAGGPEPVTVKDGLNYTYNVSPMFCAAIGGEGIRSLEGKAGSECAPILEAAISAMEADPAKYKAMNPKNGWGNHNGALNVLRTLLAWCKEAPNAIIRTC